MFLIVGLGNPGKKHEGTRHNVGFAVVDALADKYSRVFVTSRYANADVADFLIDTIRVSLVKPLTYMNASGTSIIDLVRNIKFEGESVLDLITNWKPETRSSRLLVVHDDLDLPIGVLRLSVDGSSGGHKGVQSIIDALETEKFLRLRIGIGPNVTPDGVRIPAEDFVLKRFPKSDREHIDAAIARAVEAIIVLLRDGINAAQQFAGA